MFQPNVKRKTVSFIQVWVSIVLIIAAIIASFTPLITIKADRNMKDTINEVASKMDFEDELEIPEEISVSMPKLIASIGNIIDITKSLGDAAESGDAGEIEKIDKNTVLMAAALASVFMDTFNFDDLGDAGIGVLLKVVITFIALLYVLIFTFVMPIVLTIIGLIALIRALKNMNDPEECAGKVGGVLPGFIALPLIYMLFQSFIPCLHFGAGVTLIFVFSIIGVVVSALCARLRKYSDEECKYSLIVQATSLVGVVGFVVYFFNILKARVFDSLMMNGDLNKVIVKAAEATKTNVEMPSNGHIIAIVLVVLATIFMFTSIGYLTKKAGCFAHTVKNKKGRASDFGLVAAILILLTYVLPAVVMNTAYDYSKVGLGKEIKFLVLEGAQEGAFSGALVGAIIMLVAEIALIVLKKVFVKETVTKDDMSNVISGKAKTPEEKLEDAQRLIAEAEAQAAAAKQE